MQQVRGQGSPVLLVDAGDCFFSSPTKKPPTKVEEMEELRKGRTILNAYNVMGYQALGLGPADLQLGIETLRALEKDAKFPFLSANVVDKKTKKPLFKPWVIIELSGVKFGIYSVMMNQVSDTYLNRVLPDGEILDPEKVTADVVAELGKQCDVVIALSHLNVDGNERVLDKVAGIDILIDPLSRSGTKAIWVPENEYVIERNKKPLLRIDGQGSRVGVLEMYFVQGKNKLDDYLFSDGPLEPHIMRHPEMQQLVDDFERGRAQPYKIDFDTQKPHLSDEFMGEEGCGTCHAEQLAFWKSTLHANTYLTLEKTSDQFQSDCVGCHSTGYGVTFADTKAIGRFKEVQCEGCHGVKSGHATSPKTTQFGAVNEETCWGCHNPQITHKAFVYGAALEKAACPKIQR